MSRRQCDSPDDCRQKLVFIFIMMLTILFPFIGLLALWRMFDATICWCTHGERDKLSREQRRALKQQLLVEAVLYPVLIITLTVHYSKLE